MRLFIFSNKETKMGQQVSTGTTGAVLTMNSDDLSDRDIDVPNPGNDVETKIAGRGGDSKPWARCTAGSIITGARIRNGRYVDNLQGIYCTPLGSINDSSAQPVYVETNYGGGGGTTNEFSCPSGNGVIGYAPRTGDWTDNIRFVCAKASNGKGRRFGDSYGGGSSSDAEQNAYLCNSRSKFLTGILGTSGWYLNSLKGSCTDISSYQSVLNDYAKQASCCSGLLKDPVACSAWIPGSAKCNNDMRTICATKDGFFSEGCQKWMTTSGVMDSQLDDAAGKVCDGIKTTGTADQKKWCNCFIADIPPDTPLAVKGIYRCLNPVCQGPGVLKPSTNNCPSQLTVCEQAKISSEITKSTTGQQLIANQCGNVNVGGTAAPTATKPAETPVIATSTPQTTTQISGKTIAIIGGGAGVLILLLIIMMVVMRKK